MEDFRLGSLTDQYEYGGYLCEIFTFLSLCFLICKMCIISVVPPRAFVTLDDLCQCQASSVLAHRRFSKNVDIVIGNRISIYTHSSLTIKVHHTTEFILLFCISSEGDLTLHILRLSQRDWRDDKKGVKRLSNTQRDPCKIENYSMINKRMAAVTGRGTSLSVCIEIFRIPAFILLTSQKSINWSSRLTPSLGLWVGVCVVPQTSLGYDSIIISLPGFSVYLNT